MIFTYGFLPLLLLAAGGSACAAPNSAAVKNATLEYMDPTLPPLLPAVNPKCSLLLLTHSFAHTLGDPPVTTTYAPPIACPSPWSRVVLELSASASDLQRDRTAAVWLNGAEILRTTTPLPMSPGVFWRVRKDITRYTSILSSPALLSVMLHNSNLTLPGVYSLNISLHFYRGALCGGGGCGGLTTSPFSAHPTIKGLYREPADVIIPISNADGNNDGGFWFTVRNETEPGTATATVRVPKNTYRAVLEMYASHHGEDEHWYLNPLRDGGDTTSVKSNGGFRQVVATIDGKYVGSAVTFPVIYPSSVNPYFWAPVAAIGAYDHPSYDVDLTPFVGDLIDGNPHAFALTVRDCRPYWLVSANLHVWVDRWSDEVEAAVVRYKAPPFELSRQAEWKSSDGKSEVEGEVIIRFSGWVSSTRGNITTSVRHKMKFKSHVEVEEDGAAMTVEVENMARTIIRIEKDEEVVGRVMVDTEAPLRLSSVSGGGGGGGGGGTRFRRTKFMHGLTETRSLEEGKKGAFSAVADRQDSEGTVLMEGEKVVWGKGDTKSVYKYRDNKSCYLRTVNMVGGEVKDDVETASCALVAPTYGAASQRRL